MGMHYINKGTASPWVTKSRPLFLQVRSSNFIQVSPIVRVQVMKGEYVSMERQGSNNQPLINVQEVAQRLNMAVTTIYKMVSQRRIPFVKIGGALKFDLPALEKWLKEQTVLPMALK